MAHLFVVDDDIRLTRLVREYLEREGFTVTVFHDGASAIPRILEDQPDLVLLDQMLPGADGLAVLRAIREGYRGQVLMLTARRDEIDQIVGLELGADDYVPKPASPRLVLARVKALLRRQPASGDPTHYVDGDLIVDASAREAALAGRTLDLTSAEFDLLLILIAHVGRPVSRDTLLQKLRGIAYDGIDRSIDVRVSQLRKKLHAGGQPVRIKTVRSVGYQLVAACT